VRTTNPALNERAFESVSSTSTAEGMTIQGTVHKTGFLLLMLTISSAWVWSQVASTGAMPMAAWIGAIGGFITALVTIFKKEWSPATAPLYAVFEGAFLGGISAVMEASYSGIVAQAVALTFGTLAALLIVYSARLIPVTQNFRLGIFAATGGIALVYLASWVMSWFGVRMPVIHESGPLGIAFSAFVVVIAALNLVLDFDFIEHAAERRLPKYMEWFAAFGLLVTLVWLYIEILRLLSKLRSRR